MWRRLLVPGSVRLDKLHRILQAAMGWEDCHLHMFRLDGLIYCTPFDDFGDDDLDERDVTVVSTAGRVDSFVYEYDFGDSWEHLVTVHSVRRLSKGLKFAVCLDGAGACPPEDCGGVHGYQDLLRVLDQPNDPRHRELREWAGGTVDPDEFDVAAVNTRLQTVR